MRYHKIKSELAPRIIVRNVSLWNSYGVRHGVDIAVKDGVVLAIAGNLRGEGYSDFLEINGDGLALLPAGVDAQVHLRVPGQHQKETASSGAWAAVAGGVGALLTMPNTKPVIDNIDTLRIAKLEVAGAEAETGVKVFFSAAMTMSQKGRDCVDFKKLAAEGVLAFTDDGVGVADDAVMRRVFEGAAKTGLPILQHAEVPGHGGVLADGPIQRMLGGAAYPPSAEIDMVERDLRLMHGVPGARYHVLHVSAAETIQLVRSAKDKGLQVTCEVSPHHLFFSSDDIRPDNSSFKMNPPLRSREDKESLVAALKVGDCDFMATDHAPHESEVKTENFKTSAFGTTGLETSLRVLIYLWRQKQLSSERLVDVWSKNPAKFLGIEADFGEIGEGRPFNAVLCDVEAEGRILSEADFVGLSRNSCFIGSKLPGNVIMTLLGDKIHRISPIL
jgi:dihydroorotase